MRSRTFLVAETLEDLDSCGPGTRIATADRKYLVSEDVPGSNCWVEHGELTIYTPHEEWLPAVILGSDWPTEDTEDKDA